MFRTDLGQILASRRASRLSAAVALGAALLAAGCSSSASGGNAPATPKGALTSGIDNLSDSDTLTTTLALETSATDLKTLAATSGGTLSDDAAQAIANAQLVIETKTADGSKLSEVKSGSSPYFDLTAATNGRTLVDVRSAGGNIYLQADLESILQLAGKDSAYADLQARVAQMPQFVQDAVAGKWVSVNGAALGGLLKNYTGGATTTASPQGARQMLDQLKSVLDKDVTVTDAGTDERGDHLVLKGSTRQLATDFYNGFASSIPGGSLTRGKIDPTKTPDRTITVDAWVKDGLLHELSVDIFQFASGQDAKDLQGKTMPVTLTFEPTGPDISPPSGATPVDLSQLLTMFSAGGPSM